MLELIGSTSSFGYIKGDFKTFAEIAPKYLLWKGYQPHICQNEEEAWDLVKKLPKEGKWSCLLEKKATLQEKRNSKNFTQKMRCWI